MNISFIFFECNSSNLYNIYNICLNILAICSLLYEDASSKIETSVKYSPFFIFFDAKLKNFGKPK